MRKSSVAFSAFFLLILLLTGSGTALADTQYIVAYGDDLWTISGKTGVSIEDLKAWNSFTLSGELAEGDILTLPTTEAASQEVAADEERQTIYYAVREGDTLDLLAANYQVSIPNVIRDNELFFEELLVGQILELQVTDSVAASLEAQGLLVSMTEGKMPEALPMTMLLSSGTYCVQAGDTLNRIAERFAMSVDELRAANNLESDLIFAGQVLNVSGSASQTTETVQSEGGHETETGAEMPLLSQTGVGGSMVSFAANYLNTPYVWGGESLEEGGFDCSGFVQFVYRNTVGITLKRTAAEQATEGQEVLSKDDLQAGDIVYFTYGSYIGHVGMYIGEKNGEHYFIHSSSPTTGGVIISSLEEAYYSAHYAGARRVLP